MDWRRSSACRGLDTELFYPLGDGPASTAQKAEAKSVCSACPVREECLDFAIGQRDGFGIYGGLTADERKPFIRRRRMDHA